MGDLGKSNIMPTTVVAIDPDDKNSQYAVRWVVCNLDVKLQGVFLVHVRTQNSFPPQDVVPEGGRSPNDSESRKLFLPYRGFFARNKIHSTEIVLHDLDVASALAEFIKENSLANIVLGASNRGPIARVFRNSDVPTTIIKLVPDFCSVYIASKDKLSMVKPAIRTSPPSGDLARKLPPPKSTKARDPNWLDDWQSASSEVYSDDGGSQMSSPQNSVTSSNYGGGKTLRSHRGKPPNRNSQSPQNFKSPRSQSPFRGQSMTASEFLETCNKPGSRLISPLRKQPNNANNRSNYMNSPLQSSPGSSYTVSGPASWNSSTESSDQMHESGTEDYLTSFASSVETIDRDEELQRLRLELKQTMEMYKAAHDQCIAAKLEAEEISKWKSEEAKKKEAKRLETENQNLHATTEELQMAEHLPELVAQNQETEEARTQKEAEEKKISSGNMIMNNFKYKRYSIREIEIATEYLSPTRKIAEGGYGPVYKGYLDHTLAAIKVLRHDMLEGKKQFNKEIEVLSSMRHPHLVLLLGACPEYGCLVYELMENGSLEDRLFCIGNTPPLPWKTRFKIAAEIASGLYFLHKAQPVPLVHRDLKPANILLDGNFVSKIADVGLSHMVPTSLPDGSSQYCLTAAAGTFCYIDPEYQQTGKLGTKSDLYSFGIILLQILTAKPPMGLAYHVEQAIETGKFKEILDSSQDWPVEEAFSLAKLALQCCELRKKDRPDLDSVILPQLRRLRDL